MLKFFRQRYDLDERSEISYDEALDIVLGSWKDTDMVRDMLLIPNRIECMFSRIEVEDVDEKGHRMVLMAGLVNQMNDNFEYDEENFSRVKPV